MINSTERNIERTEVGVGAVSRLFAVLRCLGECDEGGERVTQLAQRVGLSQPTTHRLLRSLMDEGMVEQDLLSKRYRLSIEFFALAAARATPATCATWCGPACYVCRHRWATRCFCSRAAVLMPFASTAAKAHTRSAPLPAISVAESHWVWGRAAWRFLRFCQKTNAKR